LISLRREKVCPQCESRKLWFISRVVVPVHDMHHMRQTPVPLAVTAEAGFASIRHQGEFEAFICAGCGWTEWYATGIDKLTENPEAGVHFIDNEPKAGLR